MKTIRDCLGMKPGEFGDIFAIASIIGMAIGTLLGLLTVLLK